MFTKVFPRLALSAKTSLIPILQQHLREVQEKMDLYDARDQVKEALWLMQWQEVYRSSDLLTAEAERARPKTRSGTDTVGRWR